MRIIIALVAVMATGLAWAEDIDAEHSAIWPVPSTLFPSLSSLPSGEYCVNRYLAVPFKRMGNKCGPESVHIKIEETEKVEDNRSEWQALCDGLRMSPWIIAPNHSPRDDRSWHLLTQSYGGTVSLLRELTQRECEATKEKLMSQPPIPGGPSDFSQIYRKGFGDIRSAECFQ